MHRFALVLFSLLAPTLAQAQVVTSLTDTTYLAVNSKAFFGGVCAPPYCVTPSAGVPLDYFASAGSVNAMNSEISRALEIGAIAAAMRDAIPNPGDRFAIRLNAAGFNGYAGGSFGVSV